eukprot:3210936-Pyramimonas_sp.AAC.1
MRGPDRQPVTPGSADLPSEASSARHRRCQLDVFPPLSGPLPDGPPQIRMRRRAEGAPVLRRRP